MSAERYPEVEQISETDEIVQKQNRFLAMYDGLEAWYDETSQRWNQSAIVEAWDMSRLRARWQQLEEDHATARLIGAVPDLLHAAFFSGNKS